MRKHALGGFVFSRPICRSSTMPLACPGTSRLLAERPGQALKACWSSYDGWLTQVASAICASNSAGQSQSWAWWSTRRWPGCGSGGVIHWRTPSPSHIFSMSASLDTEKQSAKYSNVELLLWGFIDGTLRRICRPEEHQREFYSGYKRAHCIKFQGVATPDGLLTCLHGPFEGRRHDDRVFGQTGLREQLQNRMLLPAGVYALYADAAYPLSLYLQKGYQGHHLTPAQQVFNTSMSSARQSVEWSFGEISTIFAFVDMRRQQKVALQPIGLYYRMAVLLNNCRLCLLRGNQTSDTFQIAPPLLREYLQWHLRTSSYSS